jgi:uncharacterized protein (TIGR00369 family)
MDRSIRAVPDQPLPHESCAQPGGQHSQGSFGETKTLQEHKLRSVLAVELLEQRLLDMNRTKQTRSPGKRTAVIDRRDSFGHLRADATRWPGVKHNCFGCSPDNAHGLRLRFVDNTADVTVSASFKIARRFEGPPGHVHGGIIATILDEAMGKVNRQKGVVALTRQMAIDFLHPVPLDVPLRAKGWVVRQEGRKHFHAGEILTPDGKVLARSTGLFIAIDPQAMFQGHAKHLMAGSGTAGETARLKG